MRINIQALLLLFSTLLATGCATKQELYYWGEYEELVYNTYIEPGSADPQTQIDKLTTDLQKTEANGQRVAPGIYAHLGYMYAIQGKDSQSKSAFIKEMALFPESTKFINGMMNRAMQQEATQQ